MTRIICIQLYYILSMINIMLNLFYNSSLQYVLSLPAREANNVIVII